MLSDLRKGAGSVLIKAAIVAIVFVFIFWGVGTFRTDKKQVVAKVNGEIIKYSDFVRNVQDSLRFYEQFSKKKVSEGDLMRIQMEVLSRMIEDELLYQEASSLGLLAGDDEVMEVILQNPYFRDEEDNFDFSLYRNILSSRNMTTSRFEEETRKGLMADKFRKLVNSSVRLSPGEVKREFILRNEKVNLEYLIIDPGRLEVSAGESSPEEAAAYLEEHEDEVQKYYDQNFESTYSIPEKAQVRRIFLKAGKEDSKEEKERAWKIIENIRERALKGEDFGELAKRYSEDIYAARGGDAGEVKRKGLEKDIADAIFSVETPGLSRSVRTGRGYYLYRVEEITPASIRTYDTVKEEIAGRLIREEKAEEKAKALCDAALIRWKGGEDLKTFLRENGLKIEETAPFSRKAAAIPGIGRVPELLAKVFSNPEEGYILEDPLLHRGRFYLVRIKEYLPVMEEDFNEKKGDVENELLITKRIELLSTIIDRLKERGRIKILIRFGEESSAS